MTQKISMKHKNLIYDVGMHKGEDTAFYLKKGFRVIGFEADPSLIVYCRNRFKDEIENSSLVVVEGAVVDDPQYKSIGQTVNFYRNLNDDVWGTVCERRAEHTALMGTTSVVIEVPVVNFADCIEKYGIPYYMKIDIEGMGMACLKALRDFEHRPEYISMESDKIEFRHVEDELKLFVELGYAGFKAVQQQGISCQEESSPSKEGRSSGASVVEGSSGLFGRDLPGEWKTHEQVLWDYRRVFVLYRYFGDYGLLKNNVFGKVVIKIFKHLLRKPMPGWYDTHVKWSVE